MRFEFDLKKSKSNKTKHGIDFHEAQRLWNDPELLEIPARTVDEPRFLVIGRLKDIHWSAVINLQGADRTDYLRAPVTPGGDNNL